MGFNCSQLSMIFSITSHSSWEEFIIPNAGYISHLYSFKHAKEGNKHFCGPVQLVQKQTCKPDQTNCAIPSTCSSLLLPESLAWITTAAVEMQTTEFSMLSKTSVSTWSTLQFMPGMTSNLQSSDWQVSLHCK